MVAALVLAGLAASFASLSAATHGLDDEADLRPYAAAGPPMDPLDASLSLSVFADVSVADPGDLAWLVGEATNSGTEDATNVTLEAPLDPNTTYVQSFPDAFYNSTTRTLQWNVTSLAPGGTQNVFWRIQVTVGTPDNTYTTSRLRATYENATGVAKPPKEVTTQIRVRAPVFYPSMVPTPTAAQRGDTVVARLYVNNTGSATALRAWSNWTLGGHFRFLFLEESEPVTNVTDGFRVNLTNLAPGPHILTAHLEVLRSLDDGLSMPIQSQWTATDGNGNLLVPSAPGNAVTLLAPRFTIGLDSSAVRVNTTSRFVLTVTLRNTGGAPGIGWLNMTVPNGASFIRDNASFPRSNQGRRYTWTLPSVAPGGIVILGVTFESSTDPRVASFTSAFDFTDGKGSPPASVAGPRLDVEIVGVPGSPAGPAGPADLTAWMALAAAAGGSAAILAWWWRRRASHLQIEDVFVADMAGHLLAHRSSGLVAYEDEDILIGMFKVIQDFVKDSFAKGTDDLMKSMEVGERKIIIERGQHHFISVVYRGQDRGSLAERVGKVSRLIDRRFGIALENWSGDLDELRGLASILPQVWRRITRAPVPSRSGPAVRAEPRTSSAGEQAAANEDDPADSGGGAATVEPRE
jgi:uncharacterized repeat protein (TIGR01451 family)